MFTKDIMRLIKGGMIKEEEEEEFVPVKPNPLVVNPVDQALIEASIDMIPYSTLGKVIKPEDLEGANVMELITDNWNELPDEEAIKRHYVLNHVLRRIDPILGSPLETVSIPFQYSGIRMGMKKKDYTHFVANRAREDFKKHKDDIYRLLNVMEGTGFKKGSPEAKEHMAKLRARKAGNKKEESDSESEKEEKVRRPRGRPKKETEPKKGLPDGKYDVLKGEVSGTKKGKEIKLKAKSKVNRALSQGVINEAVNLLTKRMDEEHTRIQFYPKHLKGKKKEYEWI